jgi:hypothetical protein
MSKQKVKIPNTDVEFRVNATSVSFFRGGKKTDSLSRSYIKNMTLFYSYWKALDDLGILREDYDKAIKFKTLANTTAYSYGFLRSFFGLSVELLTHFNKRHYENRISKLTHMHRWQVEGDRVNAYMCSPDHKGLTGLHFLKKVKSNLLPTQMLNLSDKDRHALFSNQGYDSPSSYDKYTVKDIVNADAVRPSDEGIFLIEYILKHHKSFYATQSKKKIEEKVMVAKSLCGSPCVHAASQMAKDCTLYFDVTCEDKEPTNTRGLGRQQKRILSHIAKMLKNENKQYKGSTGDAIPSGHICGHYWNSKELKPFADRGFLSYRAVADDVNKRFLWRIELTPLGRCMLID